MLLIPSYLLSWKYRLYNVYCVISFLESGKLYSFGNNGDGQLGIGSSGTDVQNQSTPKAIDTVNDTLTWNMLSAGNDHSVALTGISICS